MEVPNEIAAASFSTWPIYVAAAVALLGVWLARSRWLHKSDLDQSGVTQRTSAVGTRPALVYTDAPTVRLGDSQRVDRLHRIVSLTAGEHVDLLDLTFDRIPRLRIALIAVEPAATDASQTTQDCAQINIELGGAIASGGAAVKEIGANKFLVPVVTQDEQRYSILHFSGKGEALSFLRVKVLRLDPARQSADVDVLHVCGQWGR